MLQFSLSRTMIAGILAGAMCLGAVPAMADNDRGWRGQDRGQQWRDGRNQRQDWQQRRQQERRADARQDRRQQQRAYREGYRDGRQVAPRGGYRAPVYANNGWNNGGWNTGPVYSRPVVVQQRPGYGYPVSSAGWQQGRDYWYDNGRYYCRRSDGTTGAVVGAVAGGTLGNILAGQGDKTLGSIIGGTLGAIIGKEISRGNARCR